jgi:hypothetical protein
MSKHQDDMTKQKIRQLAYRDLLTMLEVTVDVIRERQHSIEGCRIEAADFGYRLLLAFSDDPEGEADKYFKSGGPLTGTGRGRVDRDGKFVPE